MARARRPTPRGGEAARAAGWPRLRWSVPLLVAGLGLACPPPTPVTTRPAFRPDPQALVVILNARPERVTAELARLVPADSLEVARFNVVDGYLETAWYDTRSHRSLPAGITPDLAATVKIRCWADPYVPGQTRLTVEPVHRPRADPSRPPRDLEVLLARDAEGYQIAQRFIDKLKERFGTPKAAQ